MNINTKQEMVKMLKRFLDTCDEHMCADCNAYWGDICSVDYVNKCTDMSEESRKELCKMLTDTHNECNSVRSCDKCSYSGRIQYEQERCTAHRTLLRLTGIEYPPPSIQTVQLRQYQNLRNCIEHDLVKPILGKDYYNMGHDVYQCDKLTTQDLANKYFTLQKQYKSYKKVMTTLVGIAGAISVILLFI